MNEIIEKHKFYVGLGGVVALYLILYMLVVSPMWNDKRKGIDRKLKRLEGSARQLGQYLDPSRNVPHQDLIDYHTRQQEKLTKDKEAILQYFSTKDGYLEQVFPEIKEAADAGKVELAYFKAVYSNEKGNLISKYVQGNNIQFPSSFDKSPAVVVEEVLNLPDKVIFSSKILETQKEFQMTKGFLELLERGKLNLLEKFERKKVSPPKGQDDTSFFTKHEVTIQGEIDFQNVPLLVQQVLVNEFFLTEIKSVDVSRKDYSPETEVIFVKWDKRDKEERRREAQQEHESGKKKNNVAVKITLSCNILDYKNEK